MKVKANVLIYKGGVTTAIRNAFTVPSGEYWKIYNETTSQFEYWNGSAWVVFSGNGTTNFLGLYVSLAALQAQHPMASAGNYANVDAGVGSDVQRYIWDNDDTAWVLQGSALPFDPSANRTITGDWIFDGFPTIFSSGASMESSVAMNSFKITEVANGVDPGDAVNKAQLDAAKSKFLGTYISLVALNIAHPGAAAGDFADVDAGVGSDTQRYIWDVDDTQWVIQGSGGSETAASIKTKYESNADTNAFTDAEKAALTVKQDISAKNKNTLNGVVDLSKKEGAYYSDYNISSGQITFSIDANPEIFAYAYFTIIGDGVTEFATQANLDSVFEVVDVPTLVLSGDKHRFIAYKTPSGVVLNWVDTLFSDSSPTATNLSISGIQNIGETLTANYTYNDANGDIESGTTFQWYRADDNIGTNETAISGGTNQTYDLVLADENKYIRFSVTPANANATGLTVYSNYSNAITNPVSSIIFEDDFTGTTIDTNKWDVTNSAYGTISQNDHLIMLASTSTSTLYLTNIISDNSFDASGDLVLKFSIDQQHTSNAGEGNFLVGFGLGGHDDSIVVSKIAGDDNVVQLIIKEGGVTTSAVSYAISDFNQSYKLIKAANGDVSLYYWNGSAWTSLVTSISTGYTSGVLNIQATTRMSSGGATTYHIDDLYLADSDFSTLNPV